MNIKKFNLIRKAMITQKNELLIKTEKSKDKDGNDVTQNVVKVADEAAGFIVHSIQNESVFKSDFGITNIKAFIKVLKEFDTFEEKQTEIVFKSDKKKIVFKKQMGDSIVDLKIPKYDLTDYDHFVITKEDVENIREALKNPLSETVTFSINKEDKLFFTIGGIESDENSFELEVKDLVRKERSGIESKFNLKFQYVKALFDVVDIDEEGNNMLMALTDGEDHPLIFVEKNPISTTKYYIACTPRIVDEFGGTDELEL